MMMGGNRETDGLLLVSALLGPTATASRNGNGGTSDEPRGGDGPPSPLRSSFSKRRTPRSGDRDAIHFGARMSACLTASSLFVLAQAPGADDDAEDGRFPEGMWVVITVLFVCWFPALDAASVLEKSVQRLAGTLVGAVLRLACGFLSPAVEKSHGVRAQAACLGACVALVSFAVCACAMHARIGRARLIERKSYAMILCLLTFTICLMQFYSLGDRPWRKSLYQVTNVVIGCFLGVALSMLVFPRPTVGILHDMIAKQIELAGKASEAVLHTAAVIFGKDAFTPIALADEILEPCVGLLAALKEQEDVLLQTKVEEGGVGLRS